MDNPEITVSSPGRINIIGEHTDYNDGLVLPAAIDKKAVFKLRRNGSQNTVNIIAANVDEQYSFDLSNFQPREKGGWQNYAMGVVHELQLLGAELKGFDSQLDGDVPIGGGMSSSAALECSLAFGLNELFDLKLDKWQMIKASQMAEHNFVGIKCGIMDQFASMMGKKNQVMLLDCRSLEFEYFPFDLGNYQLLLLNTNVSHSLASSEYNTRRAECEQGVSILNQAFPSIESLRDASLEQLEQCVSKMPQNIYKRCNHVVTESNRVLQATKSLLNKDFKTLGELIYQSHFSLQNDYKVSCPELDFLVELTLDKEYILGSRMMGGGFGGCTISIIEKEKVADFIKLAGEKYQRKYEIELTPYEVSIEGGATFID
ncbi:MAG: galactokinase [Polaribacter sp.]|jgi:galactokinase